MDKPAPNPSALIRLVDGQVRQIRGIVEVGDGPRNADKQARFRPRCENDVGMRKHAGNGRQVIDWPSLAESGPP